MVALKCPEPPPRVIETAAPVISWITAVSPLPMALFIDNEPAVLRDDAVIEPLPIAIVKLADAVTLLSVMSLAWSPVREKPPVVVIPVTATLPLPVPVPRLNVTEPLAEIVLAVSEPDPACAWVIDTAPVVSIIPALNAPWSLPPNAIVTAPEAVMVVMVVVPEKLAASIVNEPFATALPTAIAPDPPPILIVELPAAEKAVRVTEPVVEVEASKVNVPST